MDDTGFDEALQQRLPLEAQLQATLNIIPAYTWCAVRSGALTFVNERTADFLGLPNDHPLRLGTVPAQIGIPTFLFCIRMIANRHQESGQTL